MSDAKPNDSERHRHNRYFSNEGLLTDINRRSIRGGAATFGAQAVKFVIQMGSTMVMARILTPADFGLVAMVATIISFVSTFKDCGLSMATVQRLTITHEQVSNLFWINFGLSLVITLVVGLLAPLVAWFYHEPRLTSITVVLSFTFLFSGLTVQHQALLRRQMQYTILASIDVLAIAIGVVVAIIMAIAGFGFWSLIGMTLCTSMSNCLLVWVCCDWRPQLFRRNVGARSMIAFGSKLAAFDLLNYFTRNFDNILIGRVLGPAALGVYSKAYALLLLPINQINYPISGVMLPALSRLQDKPEEYSKHYLKALQGLSFVTVPMVVFSYTLARDIVLVVLGQQWASAIPVFQLLAPAALVGAINVAPGWLCISLGRPQQQLHYGIISATACTTAFLIGIRWGVEGVAASFSLIFFLLFWAFLWYACRKSPVSFPEAANTFLFSFVPSSIAGLATWLFRTTMLPVENSLFVLGFCGIAFAVIYSLAILAFRPTRHRVINAYYALRNAMSSRVSKTD